MTGIISVLIVSCYEKIDCPAYPEKYLNWLPYAQEESFSFTNGKDTVKFQVEEVFVAKATKIVKVQHASCERVAYVKTTTSGVYPKFHFSSWYGESSAERIVSYTYSFETNYNEGSNLCFGFNNENLFSPFSNLQVSSLNSYNNGYKYYSNVVKIVTDIAYPDETIDEIYVAEIVGLIQYKVRKTQEIWSLVEKK